jgi:uncharacterized membrane protein
MNNINKILVIIFLSLIIGYGFFLRQYNLGEQSYWIDEGYTLNAVTSTLEKGYPILDSNNLYGRHYLLNNYIITGFVKAFGFNHTTTRLPSLIFGLGIILLIFFFTRKYFNYLIALGASFLTSFSYWEIAWSRQARMYIQLQFFFFLSLYLFNSLIKKFSYKKLVFLVLSTIATIFSHYFGYFLIPIYAFILLINFLSKPKEAREKLWQDKKQKIIIFLSTIPLIYLLIKLILDFLSQIQKRDHFFGLEYQNFLLTNMPIITITAVLGLIIAIIREKKTRKVLGLISAYLIPYLIIVFSVNSLHFRYLFFILPILFIFSSYFLYYLANFSKFKTILYIILFSLLIISSNYLHNNTFVFKAQSHYYLEPHTPQPDFSSAYQAIINEDWDNNKIVISAFTQLDKVYLDRSDYWLAIDLHGRSLDLENLKEREYYNNAITIKDVDQLSDIIKNNSGYIVVDNMARVRLSKGINQLIDKQRLIFYNKIREYDPIWVFAF